MVSSSLSIVTFLSSCLFRRFLGLLISFNLLLACCYNDKNSYLFVSAQQQKNVVVVNAKDRFIKSQDPDFDKELMLTKDLKFLWRNPTSDPNSKGDNSQYFIGRLIHTTKGNDSMLAPTWLGFGIIDGAAAATSSSSSPTTVVASSSTATHYDMQGSVAIIGEERLNTVRKFTLGGNNHKIGDGVVQSLSTGQQTLGKLSKIQQMEYDNNGINNNNTVIETILDFQKLYIEDMDENPEPIILTTGNNVFMYAVGPSRDNPGFGVHSDAGYFLLDLDDDTNTQEVQAQGGGGDEDDSFASVLSQVNDNENNDDNNNDVNNNDINQETILNGEIVNATETHTDFSHDANHHQVELTDGLTFQWRDIITDEDSPNEDDKNLFFGRLIHRVERIENSDIPTNPTWIGFGWLDTTNNPNRFVEKSLTMDGSESIIGSVDVTSQDRHNEGVVYKYRLGGQHATTPREMIYRYPDQQQTLRLGTIIQSPYPPGSWTTILSFEKLAVELSSRNETPVRTSGENLFMWAIGPSYQISSNNSSNASTRTLGAHTSRGSFVLDFDAVRRKNSEIVGENNENDTNNDADNDGNIDNNDVELENKNSLSPSSVRTELEAQEHALPAPIVTGMCYSNQFQDAEKGQQVQLTPDLEMHWMLNNVDDEGIDSPSGTGIPSVSIVLIYDGLAWIGVGFSKGMSEMVHKQGSISVIGLPNTGDSPQLKYNLSDPDNIFAVSDQTLIESHISQENGQTILRFEKALVDGYDEATVSSIRFNTVSYAIGHDNVLGFHRHRGVFRISFAECRHPHPSRGPTARPVDEGSFGYGGDVYDENSAAATTEEQGVDTHGASALIAHAVFAMIAWALCMPFAVTSAWFRTMVPTSWIYFHVFGNVATFFFTFIAMMLGIGAVGMRPSSHHFSKGHHIVGMILFTLVTIQVINGFFRPPVVKPMNVDHNGQAIEPNSDKIPGARTRQIWHAFHRALGCIMMLLALNQIHTGIRLLMMDFKINSALMIIFWVYVLFFSTFCVVFKLWLLLEHPTARLMDGRTANGSTSNGHLDGSLAGRQMEYDDYEEEDLSFSDGVDLSDDYNVDDYGMNNNGGDGDSGGLRNNSDRSRGEPTVPQIT